MSRGDGEEEIVALAAAIVFVGVDSRGRRRRFEIARVEVREGEAVWCLHALVLIDALTPSKDIIRREFIHNVSFEGD